jgi:hypothetical protein
VSGGKRRPRFRYRPRRRCKHRTGVRPAKRPGGRILAAAALGRYAGVYAPISPLPAEPRELRQEERCLCPSVPSLKGNGGTAGPFGRGANSDAGTCQYPGNLLWFPTKATPARNSPALLECGERALPGPGVDFNCQDLNPCPKTHPNRGLWKNGSGI